MNIQELVDKAINFIVETQSDYDYICEMNGEWCAEHCIDYLRKECVIEFLTNNYGGNETIK